MASTKRSNGSRASGGGGGGGNDDVPESTDGDGRLSILVEVSSPPGTSAVMASSDLRAISTGGFALDEEFVPVPLGGNPGALAAGVSETYIVRATVDDEAGIEQVRNSPGVVNVWRDTPIHPFPVETTSVWSPPIQALVEPEGHGAMAPCPIPPCDCGPGTPTGTIADVANYLGVSQVWAQGFRGAGMVVGVVDGGITAQGRPVKPGETARRIPRVIGGWPAADWGTEAAKWSEHGNMTSTDVLGMAPEAHIYDLRISGTGGSPGTISRALQSFQWAINQHRVDGTPQVLSNSWGIFQETWDPSYARDPNHPFTRKVVEAINEGILVLFAAGNCGGSCPDGRCGPDNGPGRSIWGANGHPLVMTVGAVNKNEEFVGYSSQGPAALDPDKPDFCSITHFTGYFTSDSGTSAATPILAGAVALLKQAVPSATQASIKGALRSTAKDIGPAGTDQHSGTGIVRIKAAYDRLTFRPVHSLVTIACRQPSVITRCVKSVATPCVIKSWLTPCVIRSVTIACIQPSVLTLCKSISTPCIIKTVVGCPQRSLVCPTQVCPSLACRPGGQPPGLEWEGQVDEEPEGWDGQIDEVTLEELEAWYGGSEG